MEVRIDFDLEDLQRMVLSTVDVSMLIGQTAHNQVSDVESKSQRTIMIGNFTALCGDKTRQEALDIITAEAIKAVESGGCERLKFRSAFDEAGLSSG